MLVVKGCEGTVGASSVSVKTGVVVGKSAISGDGEAVAVNMGWGVCVTVTFRVGGNVVGVKETTGSGTVVCSNASLESIVADGEQALNKNTNAAKTNWRGKERYIILLRLWQHRLEMNAH